MPVASAFVSASDERAPIVEVPKPLDSLIANESLGAADCLARQANLRRIRTTFQEATWVFMALKPLNELEDIVAA